MKKAILVGLAMIGASALAEVKLKNELVADKCGIPNRSEEVCIAKTGTGNVYITLTRNNGKQKVFIKAKARAFTRPGAMTMFYDGVGVAMSDEYTDKVVENRYNLKIVTPVVPKPVSTATLEVNGKSEVTGYSQFKMNTVPVTE